MDNFKKIFSDATGSSQRVVIPSSTYVVSAKSTPIYAKKFDGMLTSIGTATKGQKFVGKPVKVMGQHGTIFLEVDGIKEYINMKSLTKISEGFQSATGQTEGGGGSSESGSTEGTSGGGKNTSTSIKNITTGLFNEASSLLNKGGATSGAGSNVPADTTPPPTSDRIMGLPKTLVYVSGALIGAGLLIWGGVAISKHMKKSKSSAPGTGAKPVASAMPSRVAA